MPAIVKLSYPLIGAALVALVCGCGSTESGKTLAEVGGKSITEATLDHWVGVRKSIGGSAPVDRREVLGDLIALQVVMGEAAEYGVGVTETEVHKNLELLRFEATSETDLGLAAEEPELRRLLASSGLSDADRVWLVKAQTLALRLKRRLAVEAQSRVTEREIADYYREHKGDFKAPERRDMEIFLTDDLKSAEQGKREIIAGKSFKFVAHRRNVSPEGGHDGLVMGLARKAGEPAFEKYVFAAKPHVLLGPIRQVLFYVFRVTRITPAQQRSLAEVKVSIRRRLAEGDALGPLVEEVKRRWLAKTSCRAGYVVEQCRS